MYASLVLDFPALQVRSLVALLGCEFFVSYGMTECCGKISMSILPPRWHQVRSASGDLTPSPRLPHVCSTRATAACVTVVLASPLQELVGPSAPGAQQRAVVHVDPAACEALLSRVTSSGRPFILTHLRVVALDGPQHASSGGALEPPGEPHAWRDVVPGSGEVGEMWIKGPTVFTGEGGIGSTNPCCSLTPCLRRRPRLPHARFPCRVPGALA